MPLSNGGGGAASIMVAIAFAFGALTVIEGAGVLLLTGAATDRAVARVEAQSARSSRNRQAETIASCNRGNRGRAYLQTRAEEFRQGDKAPSYTTRIAPRVYPILDCVATTRARTDVRLSPSEEARYLALFRRGREGVLRGGLVVGSRPL